MNFDLRVKSLYYFLGLMFAALSSIPMPFLPEMQLFFILVLALLGVRAEIFSLFLLSVLCTSVYAIPDAVLRLVPQSYPSIYTKGYGPLRLLDMLVVILILYALPSIRRLADHKGMGLLYGIFLISMVSLVINSFFGVSGYGYFLFGARSFLIAISISLILTRVDQERIPSILIFAMFCWLCKMLFMILMPSSNAIEREIFGLPWKIFFAGDEYLSFMLICAVILHVGSKFSLGISFKGVCYFMCLLALILALVSQRKGAAPYFFLTFIMIFCFGRGLVSKLFFSFVLFVYAFGVTLVSGVVYEVLPPELMSSLSEYHVLHESAISSISHMFTNFPESLLLGVGPAGLYEVYDLPSAADHMFSFGAEVGEKYRYAIWTMPFDRLLLNGGVLGGGVAMIYLFIALLRNVSSAHLYISWSLIPLFGFYGLTPVSAVFAGFALNALAVQQSGVRRASVNDEVMS